MTARASASFMISLKLHECVVSPELFIRMRVIAGCDYLPRTERGTSIDEDVLLNRWASSVSKRLELKYSLADSSTEIVATLTTIFFLVVIPRAEFILRLGMTTIR